MDLTPLTAISPVDGRYRYTVDALSRYFSESALIRYRTQVEVEYFIALCELPLPPLSAFPRERFADLRDCYRKFSESDARRVKEIEETTNHDVKAVEYFLKEKLTRWNLERFGEFIHFALTSQDVTNTAIPLSLKASWVEVFRPALMEIAGSLREKGWMWKSVPMLARTHGQPASPTTVGKEILVFVERLEQQQGLLEAVPFSAKFGGATGNFNAHCAAYPDIDWAGFSDRLVTGKLELRRTRLTTQIEPYDNLGAFCDAFKRINTILIDLCRDMWSYISMDYFKQKIRSTEVGSSTMPHKVNPIDFENAEGNLGVANALFVHLSGKLPISRLQRDLTDSTVIRNIGVPLAHTLIAFRSLAKGVDKLVLNQRAMEKDLADNWAVVAEAIQTILRREGYPEPYEALKELTRTHGKVDRETIAAFIDRLEVSDGAKEEMRKITPETYIGNAESL